jgi:NodT family efflux transporter outer membrane factor (OMF) lipoprotein
MFHDPILDALEARAMAGNPSLEQALARIDQATASAKATQAATLPGVAVDATGARQMQSLNSGFGELSRYAPLFAQIPGAPKSTALERTVNNFNPQVGATWDVDFAGGLRRQSQAARATASAAQAGADVARLGVSAELADAYVSYRGTQAQLQKLEVLTETLNQQSTITAVRVKMGVAPRTALDAAQARVFESRANLPLLRATMEANRNRIAVLIGQSPSQPLLELDGLAPLPHADPFGAGVPADILRWRPDVQVAEGQLVAANARIGVAMADYYPRVSLSALIASNTTRFATLLSPDSGVLQGAVGLHWRLFDFGRVDAEVRAARGKDREAIALYRETILKACEDVETGFARLQSAQQRTDKLRDRRDLLAASAQTAETAARVGQISRDAALDAQRALTAANIDLLTAETDVARSAIAARRALGH